MSDLDASLYQHLETKLGLEVGEEVVLPLAQQFMTRCLTVAQWTQVVDHLTCNAPIFLLCVTVALLHAARDALLSSSSPQDMHAVLRTPMMRLHVTVLLQSAERVRLRAAELRLRLDDVSVASFEKMDCIRIESFGALALDPSPLDVLQRHQEDGRDWQVEIFKRELSYFT